MAAVEHLILSLDFRRLVTGTSTSFRLWRLDEQLQLLAELDVGLQVTTLKSLFAQAIVPQNDLCGIRRENTGPGLRCRFPMQLCWADVFCWVACAAVSWS